MKTFVYALAFIALSGGLINSASAERVPPVASPFTVKRTVKAQASHQLHSLNNDISAVMAQGAYPVARHRAGCGWLETIKSWIVSAVSWLRDRAGSFRQWVQSVVNWLKDSLHGRVDVEWHSSRDCDVTYQSNWVPVTAKCKLHDDGRFEVEAHWN